MGKRAQKVTVTRNGPYAVSGRIPLQKEIILIGGEGEPEKWGKGKKYPQKESYDLCRCGNSKNKPYCDGSHKASHFQGTETASREPYSKLARKIRGGGIILCDAPSLCSAARFCHPNGGVWSLAARSGNPKAKKAAIREACNCPSGRLVAIERKTGKAIEPGLKKSIGLVEDPQNACSGPIWLKGGIILVGADGKKIRGAQPRHALPLRPFAQQAVLRRNPHLSRVQRRGQAFAQSEKERELNSAQPGQLALLPRPLVHEPVEQISRG